VPPLQIEQIPIDGLRRSVVEGQAPMKPFRVTRVSRVPPTSRGMNPRLKGFTYNGTHNRSQTMWNAAEWSL
jgi:hypothetical protein